MKCYDSDNDKTTKIIKVATIIAILLIASIAGVKTWHKMCPSTKDTLIVGTNTPFAPFEYKENDDITGFDVDIANAIGEKLGRKVIIKDFSDFAAILPALETGGIDIAISGITITPQRSEAANFSEPYYTTSQAVLINQNSKFKGSSTITAQDFNNIKIGYQRLTTSQTWVESNLQGISLAKNQSFTDYNVALQSLRLGGIDGIIMDKPVAEIYVNNNADLKIAGTIDTNENYGIAVKKGDPQNMLPVINKTIQELRDSGKYDELIKKHFGG